MNRAGLLRMAQEANLLSVPSAPGSAAGAGAPASGGAGSAGGVPFQEVHLQSILSSVLRVPSSLLSAAGSDFELSFPEFLETLGAIAAYKHPDPFVPMQLKLESFVTGVLVPPMRKLIRRLNNIMVNGGAGASAGGGSAAQHAGAQQQGQGGHTPARPHSASGSGPGSAVSSPPGSGSLRVRRLHPHASQA